MRRTCRRGTIRRTGYARTLKSGRRIAVSSACIQDRGAPGKGYEGGGPGIGSLREGLLRKHGYDRHATEGRRHLALAHAVRSYGALSVWRKLNAIYVYTKRTSPAASHIFKADRDWIKSHYGISRV